MRSHCGLWWGHEKGKKKRGKLPPLPNILDSIRRLGKGGKRVKKRRRRKLYAIPPSYILLQGKKKRAEGVRKGGGGTEVYNYHTLRVCITKRDQEGGGGGGGGEGKYNYGY